jgi:hypothetical protein
MQVHPSREASLTTTFDPIGPPAAAAIPPAAHPAADAPSDDEILFSEVEIQKNLQRSCQTHFAWQPKRGLFAQLRMRVQK